MAHVDDEGSDFVCRRAASTVSVALLLRVSASRRGGLAAEGALFAAAWWRARKREGQRNEEPASDAEDNAPSIAVLRGRCEINVVKSSLVM